MDFAHLHPFNLLIDNQEVGSTESELQVHNRMDYGALFIYAPLYAFIPLSNLP